MTTSLPVAPGALAGSGPALQERAPVAFAPRFWLAPWPAILAAQCIARHVAQGRPVRAGSAASVFGLDLAGAGAVIVGLPDGYAVHRTCSRGIGAIVARIYVIEPAPPAPDGTRATWLARQRWAQQRVASWKAAA
jgi:hypothetical protein